jgi:hypothetical protein
MRSISFAPVGANSVARSPASESELTGARDRGLAVPAYVVHAFRDVLERATARPASDFGPSSHVR